MELDGLQEDSVNAVTVPLPEKDEQFLQLDSLLFLRKYFVPYR